MAEDTGNQQNVDNLDVVLDFELLDTLSDEDFKKATDDPAAFAKERNLLTPEPEADPPEQPAEEQTPAPTDTDTDEVEGEGKPVDTDKPSPQVPDSWLIDPETGETYANGLILGKYDTAEKAFAAVPNMLKVIGKKTVQDPGGDTLLPPDTFVPPAIVTQEERQHVVAFAKSTVMSAFAQDFAKEGLNPADYAENLDDLKDINPRLYDRVTGALEQEAYRAEQFVGAYKQTAAIRDTLNDNAAAQAYDAFEAEFAEATRMAPDEEDRRVLVEAFNGQIEAIANYDRQVQQYMEAHPDINVFASPEIAQFYNRYFTLRAGVPILDPMKVKEAALAANKQLLYTAVSNVAGLTAAQKYENAVAEDRKNAVPAPPTLAGKSDEGVTGGHIPIMPYEKLVSPEGFEELVKAYNGDEKKAEQAYDRMIDHYDKEMFQQPRQVRTIGTKQF